MSTSQMSPYVRRARRSQRARLLLVVVFIMLRIPDMLMYYLTYDPVLPMPGMRPDIIGIVLWTTVILGAMWMRKRWARYALLVCVGYVVLIDGLVIAAVFPSDVPIRPFPAMAIASRFLLYIGAAAIVIKSKSIRSLCDRP